MEKKNDLLYTNQIQWWLAWFQFFCLQSTVSLTRSHRDVLTCRPNHPWPPSWRADRYSPNLSWVVVARRSTQPMRRFIVAFERICPLKVWKHPLVKAFWKLTSAKKMKRDITCHDMSHAFQSHTLIYCMFSYVFRCFPFGRQLSINMSRLRDCQSAQQHAMQENSQRTHLLSFMNRRERGNIRWNTANITQDPGNLLNMWGIWI